MLDIGVEFRNLDSSVKGAFIGSIAEKVTLPKNTSLYRFTGGNYLSPWWTETKYLPELLIKAKNSKKPLYQYVRDTTAVLRRWDRNGISHLVIATLKDEVTAFKGGISPQNEAAIYMDPKNLENYKKKFTKPVFFGGGNSQVYICKFQRDPNNEIDDEKKKERKKEIDKLMSNIEQKYLTYTIPFGVVSIYDNIDEIIDFCRL